MEENILGYPVYYGDVSSTIKLLISWLGGSKKPSYFACANPHSLEIARKDTLFSKAIMSADIVVPDGVGIVIASKILGGQISKRVTGSDIFYGVNAEMNRLGGHSCFFLGSAEETLAKIIKKMNVDYPGVNVSGTYSPPFKAEFSAEENQIMIDIINRAKPDVLWVGMTAPKQEKWIYKNKDLLDVKLIGPVGAVFDFYTGNVKRSHPLFQKIGLEWLPRLIREPGRLWRRNFISGPVFLIRVIFEKLNSAI